MKKAIAASAGGSMVALALGLALVVAVPACTPTAQISDAPRRSSWRRSRRAATRLLA